jgi:hypothetical protein
MWAISNRNRARRAIARFTRAIDAPAWGDRIYRPAPANTVEDYSRHNTYHHEASGQYFTMTQRDGHYYQRRHQLGPDGRETNVVEKEIQFVLGSGTHARTYLHQNPDGQLVEAPVAWYAENGGYWAMNSGYDRRDHAGFQRKIDQECFYCHNAYPEIRYANAGAERELFLHGAVPEGIDCQRCHGPGRAHIESVRSGASAAAVRAAIVNPARLAPERKLEICCSVIWNPPAAGCPIRCGAMTAASFRIARVNLSKTTCCISIARRARDTTMILKSRAPPTA